MPLSINPSADLEFGQPVTGDNEYYNQRHLFVEFFHIPTRNYVRFKAFITEWNESFDSQWNKMSVYGRNDPIMTFKGTERSISMGLVIPANDINDGVENMEKVNLLTKFLYPSYQTDNCLINKDVARSTAVLSKAPLVKIRFANMIMDLSQGLSGDVHDPGQGGLVVAMNGLKIETNSKTGFWDGMDTSKAPLSTKIKNRKSTIKGMLIPKELKISSQLTVMHQSPLGWDQNKCWMGPHGFPFGTGNSKEMETGGQCDFGVTPIEEDVVAAPAVETDETPDVVLSEVETYAYDLYTSEAGGESTHEEAMEQIMIDREKGYDYEGWKY